MQALEKPAIFDKCGKVFPLSKSRKFITDLCSSSLVHASPNTYLV